MTIEEIAEDVISKLCSEYLEIFKNMKDKEETSMYHLTLGMNIRNRYGLWKKDSSLTKLWFDDQENNTNQYIKNGVDHHPNHPDAVSGEILELIWEKLNKD